MSMNEMTEIVTLGQPVYNPEAGGFEAQAQLRDGAATFFYRARVSAAPHAEFETLTRGLTAQVLKQHRQGRDRTQRMLRDALRRTTAPNLGGLLAA